MRRVAKTALAECGRATMTAGSLANGGFEIGARYHGELCEAGAPDAARYRGQCFHRAEIDDVKFAAWCELADGPLDHGLPCRDHRQRVRNENSIGRVEAKNASRAKRRRVGVGDTDRIAKRAASDRRLRRLQHFFRHVDAEKFSVGVKARRAEKIAGGSASDLQHRSTGRRLESGE